MRAGWPLCTDRYVVCHLGDPLAAPVNNLIGDHFEAGDFYYCIIPVIASSGARGEIAFRFALFYFDSSENDFRELSLDWDNFLALLRNCQPSTTVNDRLVESIRHRSSTTFVSTADDEDGKKRPFRRCVVRNGRNSGLQLVTWKQLCRNSNGDVSFSNSYNAPTTPLLDFIDDDPSLSRWPAMLKQGDGKSWKFVATLFS